MKLHLGCGKKYIEGFRHIDAVPYDHIDFVTNIDRLPMIESGSVTLIYASHVLEHFQRRAVPDVLTEWHRVLSPNGILRLAVPDFEACARLYAAGKATLQQVIGPLIGGQTYLYNFHYNVFDRSTLTGLLLQAGFREVRPWDWRQTEHSHIDDFSQAYLPHMDKENGTLISLNLEAVK